MRAYDGMEMTRGTEIVRDDGSGVEFERVVGVSSLFLHVPFSCAVRLLCVLVGA